MSSSVDTRPWHLGLRGPLVQPAGGADLQVGKPALAGAADELAHRRPHGHVEQHVHRVVDGVHDERDGCAPAPAPRVSHSVPAAKLGLRGALILTTSELVARGKSLQALHGARVCRRGSLQGLHRCSGPTAAIAQRSQRPPSQAHERCRPRALASDQSRNASARAGCGQQGSHRPGPPL